MAVVVGMACSLASGRWPERGRPFVQVMFAATMVFICVVARFFGPLLAAPTVALGMAVAGGFHPLAPSWSSIAFAALAVVVSFTIELLGIVSPTYSFGPEGMLIRPMLTELPRAATTVYLLASSLGVVVAVSAYVIAVRRALDNAQRTALVQSWQLRQLVPRSSLSE